MDYPLDHSVDDTPKICVRRIKAGSLFILVAAGICSVFIPLFIFFGILALFGFETVHVNSHPVFGIAGLIATIIMAPIFSLIFSAIVWLALYLGIFICGSFKPFTIRYVTDDKPKA
jgi:hypothetical protein